MRINIFRDPDPEDPRKAYDHVASMVCMHKRYKIGDEHPFRASDFSGWDGVEEAIREHVKDVVALMPLYALDHGILQLSLTSPSCPWDAGQVGLVYVSRTQAAEYGIEDIDENLAKEIIRAEVKEYAAYVRGDVYGFEILSDQGEHLDSCCGFFDLVHCKEEAKRSLMYLEEEKKKQPPSMVPAPRCATE